MKMVKAAANLPACVQTIAMAERGGAWSVILCNYSVRQGLAINRQEKQFQQEHVRG